MLTEKELSGRFQVDGPIPEVADMKTGKEVTIPAGKVDVLLAVIGRGYVIRQGDFKVVAFATVWDGIVYGGFAKKIR